MTGGSVQEAMRVGLRISFYKMFQTPDYLHYKTYGTKT